MGNAIDLSKFSKLLKTATRSSVLSVDVEYPQGLTFSGDEEPNEKFLASCQRGILVPIIVDQDGYLIDGVRRCIGAFTAQLGPVPCLVVEPLTPPERLAFRVLINPDRSMTSATSAVLKGKVNFGRLPNLKYRTEILQAARDSFAIRHEVTEKLFQQKQSLFNSTFIKRQVRIAESTVSAIHQLDLLLSFYEDPPDSLVRCRKDLSRSVKTIVEFRQQKSQLDKKAKNSQSNGNARRKPQ